MTTMPDSTALTGLDAMACASGSQACSGNSAALTRNDVASSPRPSVAGRASPVTASRAATSCRSRLPVRANSIATPSSISIDETAPIIRYFSAAQAATPRPPTATRA